MSPRPSMKPARVTTAVERAVRGLRLHFPPGWTLRLLGVDYDQTALLAKLTRVQRVNEELAEARVAVKQKIAEREALHADARPFLELLKLGLLARLGQSNPLLAEFGFPVDKPRRRRTVQEKAASAAEGVWTRRLRGSYGKPGRRRR